MNLVPEGLILLVSLTAAVVELVPATGVDDAMLARALGRYAASSPSLNPTLQAIADSTLESSRGGDGNRRRKWALRGASDRR